MHLPGKWPMYKCLRTAEREAKCNDRQRTELAGRLDQRLIDAGIKVLMAYLVMVYIVMARSTTHRCRYQSSYGLFRYGLYSYGLYSYGLYSYGSYSYGS